MSIGTQIVLILIALHLVLGFGWLVYKLSPRKGDDASKKEEHQKEDTNGQL